MTLGIPTILMPAVRNPPEGEVLYLEKSEISWISKYFRTNISRYVPMHLKLSQEVAP